jgi:hypothetical protein
MSVRPLIATLLTGAGIFVILAGCLEVSATYRARGAGYRFAAHASYRTAAQWFAIGAGALLAAWYV